MTINYAHSELQHNKSAAREILPFVFNLFHPESIIDIGTGTGSWLNVSKELGIKKVLGVDGILVDKSLLEIDEEEFIKHDLTQPLNLSEKYDMAICLEVAEHIQPAAADIIIDTLTDHSDVILFSAAIPGQDGQYHINEQWPDYWQNKFAYKGYLPLDILRDRFWENKKIEWWYRQNILLYVKTEKVKLFNSLPVGKVCSKVHPELFEWKIGQLDHFSKVIRDKIWKPKVGYSFRLLIKSILNVGK